MLPCVDLLSVMMEQNDGFTPLLRFKIAKRDLMWNAEVPSGSITKHSLVRSRGYLFPCMVLHRYSFSWIRQRLVIAPCLTVSFS